MSRNLEIVLTLMICGLAAVMQVNCRPMETVEKAEVSEISNGTEEKSLAKREINLDFIHINTDFHYFEGDIMLPGGSHNPLTRNAIIDPAHKWTNNEIPFEYAESFGFQDRMVIFKALNEFNVRTCVQFRPKTADDVNYMQIFAGDGCYSSVGMGGNGKQTLSLGTNCVGKGTIQHEAMHAVGFWHEQSRYDRDDFVTILWDNIASGESYNFNKYSEDQVDTLGLPYDYSSIMHYGSTYFSKNGNDTIEVAPSHRNTDEKIVMGQRSGFTNLDLQKIRTLYGCDVEKYKDWSEWTSWSECDSECIRVRWRYCNNEDPNSCVGENEQSGQCDSSCVVGATDECGPTEYGGWGGSISSPLYPYQYINNANCEYKIKKKFDNYPIYLTFVDFAVEYEEKCSFDRFKLFDSDSGEPKFSICGKDKPVDQILTSSNPSLLFKSDYVVTDRGFKLFYFNVPVQHLCPFENDTTSYGWTQEKDDDFDWTYIAGSTPTADSGPAADHTLENSLGHYIYIETSSPRVAGDTAKISTPTIDSSMEEACLQFYYHMYGDYIGTLNVYAVKPASGEKIDGHAFTATGNLGNQWNEAFLSAPKGQAYKFVFEGIRGSGFRSDIAVDDVRLFGVSCNDLR